MYLSQGQTDLKSIRSDQIRSVALGCINLNLDYSVIPNQPIAFIFFTSYIQHLLPLVLYYFIRLYQIIRYMKSEILIYPPFYLIESINIREFISFFFSFFKLKHNHFTTLRQFLLHNKVNELYVHIYPSLLNSPPIHPYLTYLSHHRAPS